MKTRDRKATFAKLRQSAPIPCPSLLQCDFGHLADEIASVGDVGAISVHWDVMDGHFVPNLSYGAPVIHSLRDRTELIFDAHLMISDPGKYLDDFLAAGCDVVTIHLEAVPEPRTILRRIRAAGALAGLAISPGTPVERLEHVKEDIDLALVMSVEPGFGGQAFDPRSIPKLRWLRDHFGDAVLRQVDGGIHKNTVAAVVDAGAELLVAGSAIFGAGDRWAAFAALRPPFASPTKIS